MAAENRGLKIPSIDDLFTSQEEREEAALKKIYEIPLTEIDPFPDHPFIVKDDEDMIGLTESIKENGVLTPATVRKKEDGRYELLSGHRRMRACELAGLNTLRCEIVEMNRDEATIFMVESNLQRSDILPSEKAWAYRMKMEAMKRMPGRPGKGAPVEHNLKGIKSRDALAEQVGESKDQVRRYIRLTELLPELLEMVDDKKIGMRPAVELSYIPKLVQCDIWEALEQEQCTPTHEQARRMRRMSEEGKLTKEAIEAIMSEKKPNQKEKIVLRGDRFKDLFPKNLPLTKREDYVAAAMEYYGKYLERMRNAPER